MDGKMTLEQLVHEYRPTMDAEVLHSWAADVVAAAQSQLTQSSQAADVVAWRYRLPNHPWCFTEKQPADYVSAAGVEVEPLTRAIGNAQAEGWRPIATAPRDSECILLAWNEHGEWQVMPGSFKTNRMRQRHGWVVAAMDSDYLNGGDGLRFSDFAVTPTHWMPLPTPPTQATPNAHE